MEIEKDRKAVTNVVNGGSIFFSNAGIGIPIESNKMCIVEKNFRRRIRIDAISGLWLIQGLTLCSV